MPPCLALPTKGWILGNWSKSLQRTCLMSRGCTQTLSCLTLQKKEIGLHGSQRLFTYCIVQHSGGSIRPFKWTTVLVQAQRENQFTVLLCYGKQPYVWFIWLLLDLPLVSHTSYKQFSKRKVKFMSNGESTDKLAVLHASNLRFTLVQFPCKLPLVLTGFLF